MNLVIFIFVVIYDYYYICYYMTNLQYLVSQKKKKKLFLTNLFYWLSLVLAKKIVRRLNKKQFRVRYWKQRIRKTVSKTS